MTCCRWAPPSPCSWSVYSDCFLKSFSFFCYRTRADGHERLKIKIKKSTNFCLLVHLSLSSSIFLAILFVHSFLCSSFASLFRTFALIFLFSEVPLSSLVKILHGLITSVRKAQWYYKHIAAWRRTLCNKTSSCSTGSCSNIILDAVCPVNPQAL